LVMTAPLSYEEWQEDEVRASLHEYRQLEAEPVTLTSFISRSKGLRYSKARGWYQRKRRVPKDIQFVKSVHTGKCLNPEKHDLGELANTCYPSLLNGYSDLKLRRLLDRYDTNDRQMR